MFFRTSPQKTLQLARRAMEEGAYKQVLQLFEQLEKEGALTGLQMMEKLRLEIRALMERNKPGEARRRLRAVLKSRDLRDLERLFFELRLIAGEKAMDLDKEETREFLGTRPRFEGGEVGFRGKLLHFPDALSLVGQYAEFFIRESYRFQARDENPRILDCGANMGISLLYFKELYPQSRIVAFEPDPQIFSILERNVSTYSLENIELHNLALWKEDGAQSFAADGADAGHLGADAGPENQSIRVECARLSPFLTKPTDFLKMDIEGAEFDVLEECAGQLSQVRRIFIEYHSYPDKDQNLCAILAILRDAGFRVSMETQKSIRPKPFIDRNTSRGMDFRAHIFASRE